MQTNIDDTALAQVEAFRRHPLIRKEISISSYVFEVETGELAKTISDLRRTGARLTSAAVGSGFASSTLGCCGARKREKKTAPFAKAENSSCTDKSLACPAHCSENEKKQDHRIDSPPYPQLHWKVKQPRKRKIGHDSEQTKAQAPHGAGERTRTNCHDRSM